MDSGNFCPKVRSVTLMSTGVTVTAGHVRLKELRPRSQFFTGRLLYWLLLFLLSVETWEKMLISGYLDVESFLLFMAKPRINMTYPH